MAVFKLWWKPTESKAVGSCRYTPGTGSVFGPAGTARLHRSAPVPSPPVTGRAAPRRTLIGPF